MTFPVPRAPKEGSFVPLRPAAMPPEVSAGGIVIDFNQPNMPAAIIARVNRAGSLEWCLPKGHVEPEETIPDAATREIAEETGINGRPIWPLGTIEYWFTASGMRIRKQVYHYLFAATGGELTVDNDPDREAVDVAWVPLAELREKLSFANERHIAERAYQYIQNQL